jgi:hypothetical protein
MPGPDGARHARLRCGILLLKEREIMSEFRIRDSTQTDLKREFERRMHTDWQRMIAALFAFAILDYLNMGLKVLK